MVDFGSMDTASWTSLHHAYGPATDVPDLLRALKAPDDAAPKIRAAAGKAGRSVIDTVIWTLWGNVFHRGSVWQVTAQTAPYFAALLTDGPSDPKTRAFVLTYLHHLAMGYPQDDFPDTRDPDTVFAPVAGLQDDGSAPDYGDAGVGTRMLIWTRDTYEAAEQVLEAVLPCLDDPHDAVAQEAIALCASFPRRKALTRPALLRLAADATPRGAFAAVSLAVLAAPETPQIAAALMQSDDALIAVLGAAAAALYNREDTPPTALRILTQPLEHLAETDVPHTGSLRVMIGACLERIGSTSEAIDAMCRQFEGASPMDKLALTRALLTMVLPGKLPDHPAALTPGQRRALETIRDHGAFTVGDGIFANYTGLVAAWGIPQSPDEIETWLRQDEGCGP